MILNIIHDNRRPEKLPLLEAEMKRQNISYVLWPAEVLSDVVASINASHRKIVQYAKDEGLLEICIAEDDVCFPAEDGWQYFLANKPKEFSLYLGGCYSQVGYHPAGQFTYVSSPVGLHCYIIKNHYYDEFLSANPLNHIDTEQVTPMVMDKLFKVCYPMAAIQRPGWSANNKEIVNYNTMLKTEDVYGGLL